MNKKIQILKIVIGIIVVVVVGYFLYTFNHL